MNTNSKPWTPPPDPDKPNCPYVEGFQTNITTHIPPPPFGRMLYGTGTRPEVPDEWLSQVTQSKLVLTYPPLQTDKPPSPQAAKLTITKTIAIGNARGAQVVVCDVTPQSNGKPYKAVAKIYDPLYYDFTDHLGNFPADVVSLADRDYSCEAAAYEHLQTVNKTSFTPQYFGSWTFNLTIKKTDKRPVRLVLIEYFDAPSMRDMYTRNNSGSSSDLNAFHCPEEIRLEVLAQILDGVMRQEHGGLAQGDLAPRNVILVPQPQTPHRLPRVVLVDYNTSIVYSKTTSQKPASQNQPLPCSPIQRYWTESLPDFRGWIPSEWYDTPRLRQEWLISRFGGRNESLYATVTRKLNYSKKGLK